MKKSHFLVAGEDRIVDDNRGGTTCCGFDKKYIQQVPKER